MFDNPSLNVGVGAHTEAVYAPVVFGCVNIDVMRHPSADVICDVQNLPFKTHAFRDSFCFHVLEHTLNPAKALSELIRVTQRVVEIEVPHRLSRMAKSERWKKGDVSLYHVCSFSCMWFHNCLKNFVRCVRVFYSFPRDLNIHVWAYIQETERRKTK